MVQLFLPLYDKIASTTIKSLFFLRCKLITYAQSFYGHISVGDVNLKIKTHNAQQCPYGFYSSDLLYQISFCDRYTRRFIRDKILHLSIAVPNKVRWIAHTLLLISRENLVQWRWFPADQTPTLSHLWLSQFLFTVPGGPRPINYAYTVSN